MARPISNNRSAPRRSVLSTEHRKSSSLRKHQNAQCLIRGLVHPSGHARGRLFDSESCLWGELKGYSRQKRREWGVGWLRSTSAAGVDRASRGGRRNSNLCRRGLGLPRTNWNWQRNTTWLSSHHGDMQEQEKKEQEKSTTRMARILS